MWRDTFANGREHEETGKVPRLVYEHEERAQLVPLPRCPLCRRECEHALTPRRRDAPVGTTSRSSVSLPLRPAGTRARPKACSL